MKKQMKDIKNDLIMDIAGVRAQVETVENQVKDQNLKYSQLIADMTTGITTVERKNSIPTRDS